MLIDQVGMFCQVLYLPILSFTLGQLIFRLDVACNVVVDTTRLGLFLLAISPGTEHICHQVS
jgi:hypothetical protein